MGGFRYSKVWRLRTGKRVITFTTPVIHTGKFRGSASTGLSHRGWTRQLHNFQGIAKKIAFVIYHTAEFIIYLLLHGSERNHYIYFINE